MSAVRSKLARILGITSAAWIAAAAQAAYPERPIRIVVPLPTGVAARHIPMKGSTESVTAVAGSQVDYTITAITNALPMIHAGKLRALGVTGPGRHDLLPAAPTMREAAPPGFAYVTWQALFAPAATPRGVLELLNREMVRLLGEADTREFFEKNGSSQRARWRRPPSSCGRSRAKPWSWSKQSARPHSERHNHHRRQR